MRFSTKLTILFAVVLLGFWFSTIPVTAALLRGAVSPASNDGAEWEGLSIQWETLDETTKEKTKSLMEAIDAWRTKVAVPTLDSDAKYLRFQTNFLMFAALQAFVLLAILGVGLRALTAPIRRMSSVLATLKAGRFDARMEERGGREWKDLARRFNSTLDQNQTLSRLQGWQEVAAFLSHQIKNPLTSIRFAQQNVRSLSPQLVPLALENLDVIESQTARINNLVRRLKDLTNFEELDRVEVDLASWLNAWVEQRKRPEETWNVVALSPLRTAIVALLFEQAMDNLLNNSREAHDRETALAIEIDASARAGTLTLVWSDNNRLGENVSFEHVGSARYTTKREGSGLGVFFVRRVCQLHGGTLELSRNGRGGLVFRLEIEGGNYGDDSGRR